MHAIKTFDKELACLTEEFAARGWPGGGHPDQVPDQAFPL